MRSPMRPDRIHRWRSTLADCRARKPRLHLNSKNLQFSKMDQSMSTRGSFPFVYKTSEAEGEVREKEPSALTFGRSKGQNAYMTETLGAKSGYSIVTKRISFVENCSMHVNVATSLRICSRHMRNTKHTCSYQKDTPV